MIQKTVDAAVLSLFSVLFDFAVVVLKRRKGSRVSLPANLQNFPARSGVSL